MRQFADPRFAIAGRDHHDLRAVPSKQIFPGANPTLPFSAAVKADGLIYVSGTIGRIGARQGDIKAQTKQTLDNISATLKSAGSSIANAASMLVYLQERRATSRR